jgi:AGZA family xanthine/uracil permease-like MFS transporter
MRKEVLAGITTFFTMSYILLVNPAILSAAGMPKDGVIFATAVASALATFLVGFWAGLPFALAPGMGLNAYFAYTCVLGMGISYETALTAVFIEGLIFLVLSIFKFREAIFKAIPESMAYSISAGIGLFIAFIGLKNANLIVSNKNTLVSLGDFSSFPAIITVLSLIVIAYLSKKGVSGSILIGIAFATVISIIFGKSPLPHSILGFPSPTAAFKLDFLSVMNGSIIPVIVAFLLVDVFDTVGTLTGLTARLGISLKDERIGKALTCDAFGTVAGGLLGTSTVTTYIESASGIAAGGKTGATAITVSILFLMSLFLYPLISAVPTFATSAALIYVGAYMMASIKRIDWDNVADSIPAFVTFIGIPLTFSISDGIGLGFITYSLLKILAGRVKELNVTIFIISIVFLVKFLT